MNFPWHYPPFFEPFCTNILLYLALWGILFANVSVNRTYVSLSGKNALFYLCAIGLKISKNVLRSYSLSGSGHYPGKVQPSFFTMRTVWHFVILYFCKNLIPYVVLLNRYLACVLQRLFIAQFTILG